jgi:exopolysaccharide biosynthesis protein
MRTPKPKTLLRTILFIVTSLSIIFYLLADRYLIEHVEIANVSASGVVNASYTAATAAPAAIAAQASASAVTTDDWNYTSANVSIAVQKVTSGSGSSAVTYFVADVQLADATQLSSAFAKNEFGTNIIEYTSTIAAANNAIFAINGDYYGFRSDGIIIRNGVIYRDKPARTGLAFYRDGTMQIYAETSTSAEALLAAGVWNTLSFGPALIEDSTVITDFGKIAVDTNVGNRSIQGNNPRTGIGIIDANHFVFVVVDGRASGYSRGVTLAEFAQIFASLGCTEAYNIDGGGSSTMYFQGRVVNNPLGRSQERGTSDILFIGQ